MDGQVLFSDEALLEAERHNLEVAAISFLLLVAIYALYHLIFRRYAPAHPTLRLLQERLRYLTLIFVFLVPMWWAAQQLPEMVALVPELTISLFFVAILLGLESLFTILLRGGERIPATVRVWLTALVYGVPGLVYVALIVEFPLFDPAILYALGTLFVIYLCMHLIYTLIFKWVHWKHPLMAALSQRLRLWAYVLVLALLSYYAVTRYTFIPIRGDTVDYLGTAIWALVLLMLSESLLAFIFDFYFPVARSSEIPSLFRDLTRALVYIGLAVFFFGVVMKRDLDSLLVGSAVVTVAIGFALQETMGNFFAGLALRLSQPYSLGDDIKIAQVTGRVAKIDWRSTAVLTQTGDYVILPNSALSKEAIVNYSTPTPNHARLVNVGTHYRHPPNLVKRAILEAVYTVSKVLPDPIPEVYLLDFADSAIAYQVRFWINDYRNRFVIETDVRSAIWYRFAREGIEIPFPIRTLVHTRAPRGDTAVEEMGGFLESVDFLRELEANNLDTLAHRAHRQLYAVGEKVCVQGEPGDCFYIVKSGRMGVTVTDFRGEVILSAEIQPGNYFGEMALLTGEPRSATVTALKDSELIMLGKEDLRTILKENPEVEKIISTVLAQRQLRTEKAREEREEEHRARAYSSVEGEAGLRLEQLSQQLLGKIRDFFSY